MEDNECPKEKVNHPSHYNQGIEVIDFIDCYSLDFCLGNVVKYIARAKLKHPEREIEDLKKAEFYLKHEIEIQEKALVKRRETKKIDG